MNRWLSRGTLGSLLVVIAGCVDTAEPTGPMPNPPEDPGELTSVVIDAVGNASEGRTPSAAPRTTRSPRGR